MNKQSRSAKLFFLLPFFLFGFGLVNSTAQNCGNISLEDINNPGPFAYATMNQNDGIRNGPDYANATIYYPTNTTHALASVAIVPGFVSVQSSVAAWGPFLASHGIVAMIIDTNSLFDDPGDRADGLLDAIETLRQENTRLASPLLGLIDTNRFGVMGWSMGGGGAQLAAEMDPSLKAVVALCPWLSFPSAGDLNHSVPVLILSGELDPTAPVNQHANVHYNLTPATTDKMVFEVAGGNHSVANDPGNVQGEIGQYGLSWLRRYLLDDVCHCPLVLTPSSSTSDDQTNVVCPGNVACPTQIIQFNNLVSDGSYKATQTVNSVGLIPSNGVVTLQAAQCVLLDVGFSIDAGAVFEAVVQSCP